MKTAINLQTKEGYDKYQSMVRTIDWCKSSNMLDWFKSFIQIEYAQQRGSFIKWVDSHNLETYDDDSDEWHFWKVQSDELACMDYFLRRM